MPIFSTLRDYSARKPAAMQPPAPRRAVSTNDVNLPLPIEGLQNAASLTVDPSGSGSQPRGSIKRRAMSHEQRTQSHTSHSHETKKPVRDPSKAIHGASLLPVGEHDPRLVHMLNRRNVSEWVIALIADLVTDIIAVEGADMQESSDPDWYKNPVTDETELPSLCDFIRGVINQSGVRLGTLSVVMIYLNRLKDALPKDAVGLVDTRHRVFLAATIVAAKYTNDSSPKNCHWSNHSKFFKTPEINLMEKQLLHLLKFELGFSETDVLEALSQYMYLYTTYPTPPTTPASRLTKQTTPSTVESTALPTPQQRSTAESSRAKEFLPILNLTQGRFLDLPPELERRGSDSSVSTLASVETVASDPLPVVNVVEELTDSPEQVDEGVIQMAERVKIGDVERHQIGPRGRVI